MSSLVTNLNSSTAQEIVNWVRTADGCVHSVDTTQLGKFVQTRRDCHQLVALSRVGVGGVASINQSINF